MAFSRKQMVAAVAGTLSLAVLTGCPAAQNPGAVGTPTAAPSAGASTPAAGASTPASVAPTTDPNATMSPGATTSPGATPTATASGPAPSGRTVILSGNVYDEDGATVDDATITVKSLDASVPYTATATSNAGSWVVNNVPEGANVEIVATRDGWTSRRRVGSFQQQATGRRNVINFGAAGGSADNDDEDPTGEAYFISDYPEITMTTPADEATNVANGEFSYKVTFSEALTEDSRENFEDAFHILPANEEALADLANPGIELDLQANEDDDTSDGVEVDIFDQFEGDAALYTLGEGDEFLDSSANQVEANWNSEGTEVTFTFDAGLKADDSEAAEYQALIALENVGDELEDEDGNQLGTDAEGDLDGYGDPDEAAVDTNVTVYNAFKEADLAIDEEQEDNDGNAVSTDERNWASTHSTVVTFEVAEDESDPELTGLTVSEDGDNYELTLTFSEPMAAYGGSGEGIFDDEIFEASNYTFEFGEESGDITASDLDGSDNVAAIAYVSDLDSYDVEEEIVFDTFDNTGEGADDATGLNELGIEIDEDDPKNVLIYLGGAAAAGNDDEVEEVAIRVEGIADPAGNAIDDQDADDQVQIADL